MPTAPSPRTLIRAPSNLGLRPLRPGHVPGTWRGPAALTRAGLVEAVAPARIVDLAQPKYETEVPGGTGFRNGHGIRAFGLALADAVAAAAAAGEFPVVVGGDCSILMGALAGIRRSTPLSLVHVDGHSDFRNPANQDFAAVPGTAAGADLALATGRGEALLTDWPSAPAPLVPDVQTVQIGERDGRRPEYPWMDIRQSGITQIDVFTAREIGPQAVLARTRTVLDCTGWPFWVHLDLDVLDQSVMPAVDTPGSPGIDQADLVVLLRGLLGDARCAGVTVAIFDPDLDPDGAHAGFVVSLLRDALA